MALKQLRVSAGLTQAMLADKIGVERSAIAKWETGKAFPKSAMLPAIAKALGCEIADLYGTEDGEPA